MRDRSRGRVLHHQQNAEVVIGFGVGGIEPENGAKFLFSRLGLLLREIYVAEVIVRFGRSGIELKGLVQRCDCACIVLLIGLDDAQQVVSFHAGGMALEFVEDGRPGLRKPVLLDEGFYFAEAIGRGLGLRAGAQADAGERQGNSKQRGMELASDCAARRTCRIRVVIVTTPKPASPPDCRAACAAGPATRPGLFPCRCAWRRGARD